MRGPCRIILISIPLMTLCALVLQADPAGSGTSAPALRPEVKRKNILKACASDVERYCQQIPDVPSLKFLCLLEHQTELSAACRNQWTLHMTEDEKAFYECHPTETDHSSFLWTPEGASQVRFVRCGEGDMVNYQMEMSYPAGELIKQIQQTAVGDAWFPLGNNPQIKWGAIRDRRGRESAACVLTFVNRQRQVMIYILNYPNVQKDTIPNDLHITASVAPVRLPYSGN